MIENKDDYIKRENSIIDLKPVTKVELHAEGESSSGHREQFVDQDFSSDMIKNEIYLTEAENEQYLEEDDYIKRENSIIDLKPVTKVELHAKGESSSGHSEQFVDQCSLQDINTIIIKEENILEDTEEQNEQQLDSLAVIKNYIHEEVNSPQTSEQYKNGFKHSESDLFSTKKLHQCDICPKTFTRPGRLLEHKLLHAGIKKYQCDICSKIFTESGNLSKHKLIHAGIKKYKCDICSNTFNHPSSLSQHKLIHAGIKKYQCDICNKAFTSTSNLSRHKLIHVGIKKYQCDICNKAVTTPDSLSKHKKIHSGIKYQCDICSKTFIYSYSLSQHKLIHAGIKKYQCDICNKAFTTPHGLSKHKKIHAGNKVIRNLMTGLPYDN